MLGDEAGDANLVDATAAGLEAVTRLGGAHVGDKTMVDAFVPAVQALQEQGDWRAATDAARKGAESTKDLVAKVGRARPLGEEPGNARCGRNLVGNDFRGNHRILGEVEQCPKGR